MVEWRSTVLDDILEPGGLFDGPFGSSLKTNDYTENGVRVVRLENIANLEFVDNKKTFISHDKYASLKKHTIHADDIIVGSFVDGDMRVCVLPNLTTAAIAKADCFTVRTKRDIANRQFVAFQLAMPSTRDLLLEHVHGATRPRITTKQLRACPVRLPPLSEQRRIVADIQALFEEVNLAAASLTRLIAVLDGADAHSVVKGSRLRQLIVEKMMSDDDSDDLNSD